MMDTKDWDGLAAVFTDDVEIDMTGEGGGVTRSVAEYMPFLREHIEDVTTVHHGHMPEITITSRHDGHRHLGDGGQAAGGPRARPSRTSTATATTTRPTTQGRRRVADQDDDAHPPAP